MRDRFGGLFKSIDPIEFVFGTLPFILGGLTFMAWASVLVRKIRGEEVRDREEWGLTVLSVLFFFARSLMSRLYAQGAFDLHRTVVEMRAVTGEAAEDARQRDERSATLQKGLNRLTKLLVWLAALTLGAAAVTLVVTIIRN
jgi:hypothetical protein